MANGSSPARLGKRTSGERSVLAEFWCSISRAVGLLILVLFGGCVGRQVEVPTLVIGSAHPTGRVSGKALPGLAVVDVSELGNADTTWRVEGYGIKMRVDQREAIRNSLLSYGQMCFERVASGTRGLSNDARYLLGVKCQNLRLWQSWPGMTSYQYHAKMELTVTVSDPDGVVVDSAMGDGIADGEVTVSLAHPSTGIGYAPVIEQALQSALDQAFQRIRSSERLQAFAALPFERRGDGTSARVSCDLRLISASEGSGIASASGEVAPNRLDVLAKALAGKLKEGSVSRKGESIAVVSLRNRSGTSQGKVVADELADKVQGALIDTGWFDVKERIDLRAILDEKDLDTAGIVKNENVRKKLAGVKYIVIGGVTVTEQQKP